MLCVGCVQAEDQFTVLDRGEDKGWVYVQCVANRKTKRKNRAKKQAANPDDAVRAPQHTHKVKRGLIPTTHLQALLAAFDWDAQASDELSFKTGDKLIVLDRGDEEGWLFAELMRAEEVNHQSVSDVHDQSIGAL